MTLILSRHGEALSSSIDPREPLSPNGEKVTQEVARHLHQLGMRPDQIQHSTKLRAKQTAEIFGKELGVTPGQRDGLKPNDPVDPLVDELTWTEGSVMIVAHLPFLSRLVSKLLLGDSLTPLVYFAPSASLCLEKQGEIWVITALIPG